MKRSRSRSLLLAICFTLTLVTGCASKRKPVPPGVIPQERPVSAEDEEYGQKVLSELATKFQLSRSDADINRTRDIVDRLAHAAHADREPWNVYVLVDRSFKNAAATRGNFVFIWSGLLDVVQNDDELAAILGHEMGHVLAGHTTPDPSEEANNIISGVTGSVAGTIIGSRTGVGILGDLGESVIRASLDALISNPNQQRLELEADQIGLFLLADAGYDPEKAVAFWERVKADPDFGDAPLEFLSSHPSSETRLEKLRQYLPDALDRYRSISGSVWSVSSDFATVYEAPSSNSRVVDRIPFRNRVFVAEDRGRWLKISGPVQGFIRESTVSPAPTADKGNRVPN